MSDDFNTVETPKFEDMAIGTLRQYASHLRVALAKTATKAEIIKSIEAKLNGKVVPEFAEPDAKVKPGYAKIRLLEDGSPGASNYPVFLNCNGYICTIPRGVDVIVPQRVVRTLNDAVVHRKKQQIVSDNHGRETFKDVTTIVPSYPFQILEMTPGPEVLTSLEATKRRTMGPRNRYRAMFGRWPKQAELVRAIEQGLIKLDNGEIMGETPQTEAA